MSLRPVLRSRSRSIQGGYLAGDKHPHTVTAAGHSSWLASAAFPGPALLAAAVAVTVAAAPWLSRPWRRTAWITLAAVGTARLITGTILPAELVLAFASGVTVGAAVLVAFGVPDRRIGPDGIAAALRFAGLPVASVEPADVQTKGSRPFTAVTGDGRRLFIKALGSDQRDADLLYRAYRFTRLRHVGDTWPAASVMRAAEHQALIAVMAERAGVRVPRVDQVIKAGSGTALLVMDQIDGSSLGQLPAQQISDGLAASVQAFGGHAGITEIGAVYLGAAVIAAASPTPGGLGAIEAALVAGLTGIGVPPGPAVSAVLTYRLATYWLPVIPGWAAWQILQRRDYV